MAFRDDPAVRENIRKLLKQYIEDAESSYEQIQKYIEDHRNGIAPKANTRRAAIDHGTIGRFVENSTRSHVQGVEILYNFLAHVGKIVDPDIVFDDRPSIDHFYKLIREFFGVRDGNDMLCKSVIGTYTLYFSSEERRKHVVRGSIKLSYNVEKDCFEVFEHQEIRKQNLVEEWEGYYFARRERIVIILRGKGTRLDNMPKIYMIRTPIADKDGIPVRTTGRLTKLGAEAAIFDMPVVLERDDNALSNCDVIPNRHKDIDSDVLHEILATRVG